MPSPGMPPLKFPEPLPPAFDAIASQALPRDKSFLDRAPEHLVMPFETLHVIGRLDQESKQIQQRGRVLALWVEPVEVRPLHFDGIAVGPAPLPVEIHPLPAVADRRPDLAPSGLRPQHLDHYPPA